MPNRHSPVIPTTTTPDRTCRHPRKFLPPFVHPNPDPGSLPLPLAVPSPRAVGRWRPLLSRPPPVGCLTFTASLGCQRSSPPKEVWMACEWFMHGALLETWRQCCRHLGSLGCGTALNFPLWGNRAFVQLTWSSGSPCPIH